MVDINCYSISLEIHNINTFLAWYNTPIESGRIKLDLWVQPHPLSEMMWS